MTLLADCGTCAGRGYVRAVGTAKPPVDACPECAGQAEVEWMARQSLNVRVSEMTKLMCVCNAVLMPLFEGAAS